MARDKMHKTNVMSASIFTSDTLQELFDRDGIVNTPLLSPEDIAALNVLYNTIPKKNADLDFHSTMFVDDTAYRMQVDAGIKNIILPRLQEVVRNYRMPFANFIVKEPKDNTSVGIHQDWHFTAPEYTSINIWIPLVDITEQTGLFYGLKGSHQTFNNLRYTPYENNRYTALKEYILSNSTPFAVKAGSALIYHGAMVHFSDPNRSDALRIAVGGAMVPEGAPSLHYFKRDANKAGVEVYEVNNAFYHSFDFLGEPKGVRMIEELQHYSKMPALNDLTTPV
jgi:hypothetical protein